MVLPDNRLRFDTTLIDFAEDVGLSGQTHEDFPGASQQARYDWLLMWFMSLLSNQSSFTEPNQFRDGTLWFDLNNLSIKIRRNDNWDNLAEAIAITEGDDTEGTISLAEWITANQPTIDSATPSMTFSGDVTTNNITTINIPTALQASLVTNSRALVYQNGLLLDPRNVTIQGTTTVKLLNGDTLGSGDRYTIVISTIPASLFHEPDVDL